MEITIIGTGKMARGIGTRALAGGHSVKLIGKDRSKAEEVAAELGEGAEAADRVSRRRGGPRRLLPGRAGRRGGSRSRARRQGGRRHLEPGERRVQRPRRATGRIGRAGDRQARTARTRVVKAFNTTFAGTLVEGQVKGEPLDVFIAGDDDEAKSTVRELAESAGLNPIDVGPLASARYLEEAGFLHISLQERLGSGFGSALKVIS